MKLKITSLDQTKLLSEKLVKYLKPGFTLLLEGNLAAGKTTLTKYIAQALNFTSQINSPTFNIFKQYQEHGITLNHIDAYRLEGISQDLGFEDELDYGINIIEWANFLDLSYLDYLLIKIELIDDYRIMEIIAKGEFYQAVLKELENELSMYRY